MILHIFMYNVISDFSAVHQLAKEGLTLEFVKRLDTMEPLFDNQRMEFHCELWHVPSTDEVTV